MATFGFESVGSSNLGTYLDNTMWACRYQYTAADGTSSKLTAYLDNIQNVGACYFKAVVYSDSASTPNALLGAGTAVQIAGGASAAWVDLPIVLSLTQNAYYWLGFLGDADATQTKFYYQAGTTLGTYREGQTFASPDASWGASSPSSQVYSVYCTYEVDAVGFTGLTVTRVLNG